MKKIGKAARKTLLFAVILALALCAGCSGNPPESSGDAQPPAAAETSPSTTEAKQPAQVNPLDAAFASGETIRLVPADLPGSPGEDYMPVGVSPDGETVIWRNGEGFAVTRNGETRPVVFNAERGAGDPYQMEKKISLLLKSLPSWEGFSWSADGRYVALSEFPSAKKAKSLDPAVLDTATGEIYLAKAYNMPQNKNDAGLVFLTRIDRAGRWLYYLAVEREADENRLCFCRCPVEGGEREVLCDTAARNGAYETSDYSALYETRDGSWILNGITGFDKESYEQYALIRFSPSGDGWIQEVIPTGIPAFGTVAGSVSCFSQSGYGLFCLLNASGSMSNIINNSTSAESVSAVLASSANAYFFNRISLLRVLPGAEAKHDVWGLVRTGDGTDMELVSSDDLLWLVKKQYGKIDPGEEAAFMIWLSEHYDGLEDLYNQYFSEEARNKNMREETFVSIPLACMSPDGRYALMNTGSNTLGYKLYMLSLETMQILPVETSEGLAGMDLTISAFGAKFMPGIVWSEDGTLLVQNSDTHLTGAYRLETGPAR